MIRRSLATVGAVATIAMLGLTACSSGADAPAASGDFDAKTATSAEDFGGFDALVKAAQEEGELNVIALPENWANYGKIIAAFEDEYGITVNSASPDVSSAEEIQAADNLKGQDTAPDVFDLGTAVALESTDYFAPYQVQTWDDIPAENKEATGLWVNNYTGIMSIGYDSKKFDAPKSLDDLLDAKYKGSVALNGDPTQAGAAFAGIGMATLQRGGELDDFQPGIDFFSDLQKAGNLLKVDVTTGTIASGETPVVFDWDYLNATHSETNSAWKVKVFDGTGYAGYYNQAINKDAPHPAAARLWQEFLYSDEVQNLWLAGGARPVRMEAMTEAGTIDATLAAALPAAPAETVVPTEEQSANAGTLLGEEWAAAVQ